MMNHALDHTLVTVTANLLLDRHLHLGGERAELRSLPILPARSLRIQLIQSALDLSPLQPRCCGMLLQEGEEGLAVMST